MSYIPPDYAKSGRRSSVISGTNPSKSPCTLRSPFDVLKPGYEREDPPKTRRTVTSQGTVLVQFTEDYKKDSRSAMADAARAPKFNVVDHEGVLISADLASLPSHRHGFST